MKVTRRTVSIVALVFAACGGSPDGASMESVEMPPAAGRAANAMQPSAAGHTAGSAGKPANAGGATSSGAAGSSGGSSSASGSQLVAVAMIMPLMSSTGAAGAAGASTTASSGAKAGSGGSSGSAGMSQGGSAGKAGSAGSGSGAGLAVVYGQATFTRLASTDVAVKVEVMGCDNGKSYPVHIHEGTSCDSVMSQGGHWGAVQTPEPLPMQSAAGAGGTSGASGKAGGAAGGGGSNAGAGGHTAGHAAGSGATTAAAGSGATTAAAGSGATIAAAGSSAMTAAAGSGAMTAAAGSGAMTMMLRGEGIPDINCTGTTGASRGTRDSLDDSLRWTIGTMDKTDLLGHVVVIHDGADRIACGKIEIKQ